MAVAQAKLAVRGTLLHHHAPVVAAMVGLFAQTLLFSHLDRSVSSYLHKSLLASTTEGLELTRGRTQRPLEQGSLDVKCARGKARNALLAEMTRSVVAVLDAEDGRKGQGVTGDLDPRRLLDHFYLFLKFTFLR